MSRQTPNIDIRPDQWEIVRTILREHVPGLEVWAFGSRAKWTAKEYSDLDLAIITDTPLPLETSAALNEAFSESDLPWKVDVVDWAATGEDFRRVIETQKTVLSPANTQKNSSANALTTSTGDVTPPPGWQRTTLEHAFHINPSRPIKRGAITPFIPMDALSAHTRKPERIEQREFTGTGTRFQNGDTLIARITPCLENGKTVHISELNKNSIGHGSTEYIILAGKQGISDNLYGYYIARSQAFRDYAISRMEGTSGRQRVPASAAAAYAFNLPPLQEQRTIAHILGTLDDKIELNRRMNETLEAMARALFKAWFVDFEPVHAKMEGRWKRGQSLPGLPEHLYDSFPDYLVETDFGAVPAGWSMRSLDTIASYLNGLALQKFPPKGDGSDLPVIKIAQLRSGTTASADLASRSIKPEYVVQNGDVLFSWSGTLEVAIWNGGMGALNQHLFKVTSTLVPKWFYFFATLHHLTAFRSIAANKATTMGHIQRHHLTAARIATPLEPTLKKLDSVLSPLFNAHIKHAQSSRNLATVRDALLPKLISGELRIPDLEQFLQGAGLS